MNVIIKTNRQITKQKKNLFHYFTDSLENRIAHYSKKRRIEILSKDELIDRKKEIGNIEDDDGNE